MGLSRLSERCHKCRYVDTCEHKEMEGLLMAEAAQPAAAEAAAPVLAALRRGYGTPHVNTRDVPEFCRSVLPEFS